MKADQNHYCNYLIPAQNKPLNQTRPNNNNANYQGNAACRF